MIHSDLRFALLNMHCAIVFNKEILALQIGLDMVWHCDRLLLLLLW
jgi:hypothetical protein